MRKRWRGHEILHMRLLYYQILLLFISGILGHSPIVFAGDDYPFKNEECTYDVCHTKEWDNEKKDYIYVRLGTEYCKQKNWCIDPWGFFYKECTSYVAWRMNRDAVDDNSFTNLMDDGHWGNGAYWNENAEKLKWEVNNTPAVGAIAQWDAWTYGHVAYVEKVNSDGTVNVSEYNFPSASNQNKKLTYGERSNIAATNY